MSEVVLFAGPSAHGLTAALFERARVRRLPPAQRGDIESLVETAPRAGVILLCDGVFQAAPAVSHAELCSALDAGWQVWGVSSMGAIRAHEMRFEGMQGYGWVHAQFSVHSDFKDDEMALLHFPGPPYFQVSEALVNIRYALACRATDLGVSSTSCKALIDALRELWFGDRTEDRVRELMVKAAGMTSAQVEVLLQWLPSNRIKNKDLAGLLNAQPWL